MAKQKSSNGGKQNKTRNAPKGQECAVQGAIGRERKKAQAKAQALAKAAIRAVEQARLIRENEEQFASASESLGMLAGGLLGRYIVREGDDAVIIRVAMLNMKPVAYVEKSTVAGIIACDRKFIPVATFRYSELQQVTPEAIFEWQVQVHAFLRKHLGPYFVVRVEGLGKKWQEENPATFDAESAPQTVQPKVETSKVVVREEVDVTSAVPMSGIAFMGVKQGHSRIYVEKDSQGHEAYFLASRTAGVQMIALVRVDEGHELHKAYVSHLAHVRIHLQDLVHAPRPYDSNVTEMKDARESLRQHLRFVAFAFGVKAKHSQEKKVVTLPQQTATYM